MNPRLTGLSSINAINPTHALLLTVVFASLILSVTSLALRSYAQVNTSSNDDLSSAIKSAILADPRSDSLSSAQITAMVDSLTKQASAQGMKARDLMWRPLLAHSMAPATAVAEAENDCGNLPAPLCTFNKSLGLNGSDVTFFVWLGVALTIILALIAGALEVRHWRKTRSEMP